MRNTWMVLALAALALPAPAEEPEWLLSYGRTEVRGRLLVETLRGSNLQGEREWKVADLQSIGLDPFEIPLGGDSYLALTKEIPFATAYGTITLVPYKTKGHLERLKEKAAPEPTLPEPAKGPVWLRPARALPLVRNFPSLCLSRDRQWVYVLDADRALVRRVNTATDEFDSAVVRVAKHTSRLVPSPSGDRLYTIASRDGFARMHEIDPDAFKRLSTFDVPLARAWDLVAGHDGYVLVSAKIPYSSNVVAVNLGDRQVTRRFSLHTSLGSPLLAMHPTRPIAYAIAEGFLFRVGWMDSNNGNCSFQGQPRAYGFFLTADGKRLVTNCGKAYRLDPEAAEDLREVPDVLPFRIGVSAGSYAVLFTNDGKLVVYSSPDLVQEAEASIGVLVTAAAIDPLRRRIYCAVTPEPPMDKPTAWGGYVPAGGQRLLVFDASGVLPEARK